MRKLYLLLVLLWWNVSAPAQPLKIGNIGFIGTGKGYTDSRGAILTSDGNLLIVGTTNGNNGGDIPSTTYGQDNVFVTKTGKDGKIDWIKIFGGSQNDYGCAICKAKHNGYGILARTLSGDGDITGFKGTSDIWLIKLDEDGNKLWSKTYGSPYSEEPVSIAATPDGGFIILGVSNGYGGDVPFHFGINEEKDGDSYKEREHPAVVDEDEEHYKMPAEFLYDWFVIKVDRKGRKQWAKVLGGEGDESAAGSILVAEDGYYLVSSSDSKDHDCAGAVGRLNVKANKDYYLQKLDKRGNLLWSKSYGGTSADVVQQAIVDERDQSIVIAGYTSSNDMMVQDNRGDTDIWLVKTDKDGNFKWGKTFGGEKAETDPILATTAKGYALYTKTRFKELGKDDTWLLLLDSDGNLLSDKPVGGSDHDYTTAVFSTSNGYILIGNSVSGSFNEGKVSGRHGATEETFVLTVGEAGVAAIPAGKTGIAGSKN